MNGLDWVRGSFQEGVGRLCVVLGVMLRVAFSLGIAYGGYALGRAYPEGIDGLKRLLGERNQGAGSPTAIVEKKVIGGNGRGESSTSGVWREGSGSVATKGEDEIGIGGVLRADDGGERQSGGGEEEEEEEEEEEGGGGDSEEEEDDSEEVGGGGGMDMENERRGEWERRREERRRRRQAEIEARVQMAFEREKEKMQQLLARERERTQMLLEREKVKERRRVAEEKEMEIQQLRRELDRERQKQRDKLHLSFEQESLKNKDRVKRPGGDAEEGAPDRKAKKYEEEYQRWRIEHLKLRDDKERLVEELRRERDKVREEDVRQRRAEEVRERQWRELEARKDRERQALELEFVTKMQKLESEKLKLRDDLGRVLRDLYMEREKARNREREESQRELARRRSSVMGVKESDNILGKEIPHENTVFDESTFRKWIQMRLGREDKTVYWYWTGTLCSYPELETLARVEEYHALRMLSESPTVINEFSRNVTVFRDRETNQVLTDYNKEPVSSRWHPCDHTVYTLDGPRLIAKVTTGFGEYMRTRINIVKSVFHLHSTTKVAFSYYVKGSRYEYTNYDYIMDEAATEEPGSCFCSMVRLGTFRPFAEKAVANLMGWRIDEYEKLPPTIKDCLASQNSLWREAPKNLDEIRRLQKVSFARSFSTSRSSSNSS